MILRDYIERMKIWIDKQHFIMRHYKFALGIFLIITVGPFRYWYFLSS